MTAQDAIPALQRLRGPAPETTACKVCGGPALLFGAADFNRACAEVLGKRLPRSGVAIPYRRCRRCGLVFTNAFDDWSPADFAAEIYNEGYAEADPEYEAVRPSHNARLVAKGFAPHTATLRILDYGGGNGRFARELRAAGFAHVETYDPFHPDFRVRPEGRFDLVTCFETLEHMPDPVSGAADILSFLADPGMVFFGTLVQPPDFDRVGMGWWYIGPRNGHVTIFSYDALATLWGGFGLQYRSATESYHAAYRSFPTFASGLMAQP